MNEAAIWHCARPALVIRCFSLPFIRRERQMYASKPSWSLFALLVCANCYAADEYVISPVSVGVFQAEKHSGQVGNAAIHDGPFSGLSLEAFVISTAATGSGGVTLAHQCTVPFLGWLANCVEWEGRYDVQGANGRSVGVRIAKKSRSDDVVTFDWGGELYPLSLSSSYVSSNSLVFALFTRAEINILQKATERITPYLGVSLGWQLGHQVEINYPGMPRAMSANADGNGGSILFGVSKSITPAWDIFVEGRVARFSATFPSSGGQSSMIYGDSGDLNWVARQVLVGLATHYE